MGRGAKIALAGALMATGLVGATLFRRQDSATGEPPTLAPPTVDSRRSVTSSPAPAPLREPPATVPRLLGSIETEESQAGDTAVETHRDAAGSKAGQWRPASAARPRPMEPQSSAYSGPVAKQVSPEADDDLPADSTSDSRLHVVHDGDTLSSLARRYLGSSGRYLEIYEANRDRLPSPDVLPIGAELRIPRGAGRTSVAPQRNQVEPANPRMTPLRRQTGSGGN